MTTYLVSLSLFSFLTVPVAVGLDWLESRARRSADITVHMDMDEFFPGDEEAKP